jgi:hypothetical protein
MAKGGLRKKPILEFVRGELFRSASPCGSSGFRGKGLTMRRACSVSLAGGIVSFAITLSAGPPPSLRIVGDERACPSPGQVGGFLAPLLPSSKLSTSGGAAALDDVAILDEGGSFRVVAAGQERSFVDVGRQCLDRARHAAVFVALALDPPAVSNAKASLAPERAEAPVELPPVPSSPSLDLEFGGMVQSAPGAATRDAARAGGVAARVRWGRGLHLSGGLGFLPGTLHFQTADAQVLWFPIDVALGLNLRSGSYEIAGDVGPAITVVGVTGQGLEGARRQWRVEPGARAGAVARAWISERFGVFLSAHATAFPWPYPVVVDPDGSVGSTPWLWWGGSLGIFSRIE